MLSKLKIVINELRKGENVELYIIIVLAVVVAVLDIMDKVGSEVTGAVTLAVLGLLASSLLENRRSMAILRESTNDLNAELLDLRSAQIAQERSWEVFLRESEAQTKIQDIVKQHRIENARIFSYGLVSRRILIGDLLDAGVRVEILAQHPESAVDKANFKRIKGSVRFLKIGREEELLGNLTLLLHRDVISLRAIILDEVQSGTKHLFFGWYTYEGSSVHGSQNPTLYSTNNTEQGNRICQWLEDIIEKSKKRSEKVSLEQLRNYGNEVD